MTQSGALTTHVLDTANGCPAAGIRVELFRIGNDGARSLQLADLLTNADGRSPKPLLAGETFLAGRYCLDFALAKYYRDRGAQLPEPPFLDVVTVCFGMSDEGRHYHVPLLISPFGYTTYCGS